MKPIIIILFSCFAHSVFGQTNNEYVALQIDFSGIFMGECGNPNPCTHEKVAGLVLGSVVDRQGNEALSTTQSRIYFRSADHSLVCSNLNYEPDQTRGEGLYTGGEIPRAGNVNKTMVYYLNRQKLINGEYIFQVDFNLGNPHQDNPFAAVGHHWLEHGDTRIELDFNLKDYWNRRQLLIGPYETQSDRCHYYYLQFNIYGE